MPIGFLSEAERERLDRFPPQIVHADLITFFTLSPADRVQLPRTTTAANRLGFALQLGALRYLGFSPDDLTTAPEVVVAFVAEQLDVAPHELTRYARRGQTRTERCRVRRPPVAHSERRRARSSATRHGGRRSPRWRAIRDRGSRR